MSGLVDPSSELPGRGTPELWHVVVIPLTLAFSGVYLVALLLPDSWTSSVPDAFYEQALLPVSLVAALGAWRSARRAQRGSSIRRAWFIVSLAFWSWFASTLAWMALGFPEVSVADVGFIAFYPLVIAGLLAFPARGARASERVEFWIDVSTVAVGGFMLVWYFVLGEMVHSHHPHLLSAIINYGYPILSLILLLGSVSVWLQDPVLASRRAVSWLTVGALAFFVADIVYAAQSLVGSYEPGGVADAGWFIATMAFVLASSDRDLVRGFPRRRARGERWGLDVRYLPYVASTGGYAILLYATASLSGEGTRLFIVCGTILTILVLIRQIRSVREYAALEASHAAAAARASTESRFLALARNSSDVVLVLDPSRRVQFASPPMERDFGFDAGAAARLQLNDWVHPEDLNIVEDVLDSAPSDPTLTVPSHFRVRRKSGEWRRVECLVTDMRNEENIGGIVLNLRDITEREALEAHLTHRALHDPLTGLANRALFRDRLQHALDRDARASSGVAVLYIDLDHFKEVNDGHGHGVGDLLLCHIAERLLHATRGCDTVARLGGDEFAVLQEGVRSEAEILPLTRRILASACKPAVLDGHEVAVGLSIGVAVALADDSVDEVLRNADLAMYRAKRSKKVVEGRVAAGARVSSLENGRPAGGKASAWCGDANSSAPALDVTAADGFVRWGTADADLPRPSGFVHLDDSTVIVIGPDQRPLAHHDGRASGKEVAKA